MDYLAVNAVVGGIAALALVSVDVWLAVGCHSERNEDMATSNPFALGELDPQSTADYWAHHADVHAATAAPEWDELDEYFGDDDYWREDSDATVLVESSEWLDCVLYGAGDEYEDDDVPAIPASLLRRAIGDAADAYETVGGLW